VVTATTAAGLAAATTLGGEDWHDQKCDHEKRDEASLKGCARESGSQFSHDMESSTLTSAPDWSAAFR
jgi:hypothetical protein